MIQTTTFDKYDYYLSSVQSPEADAEFLERTYRELSGKAPKVMREDFCGTFALCAEWVKRKDSFHAVGVDLDPEPLEYGSLRHLSKLTEKQRKRLSIVKGNVLSSKLPAADIVCALNFSYFCFKDRATLKRYFTAAAKSLNPGGIFLVDCFGGPECMQPNEQETEYDDYSYYWDQDGWNPITQEAMFYIHFKRKGERKREKVFTYDWRMWTIPELKDLMAEAGLKDMRVYWEGTDKHGEGNGIFSQSNEGEVCDAWVAYIVGIKK